MKPYSRRLGMIGQSALGRLQTSLSEPHERHADRLMRICSDVDISEIHAHQGRTHLYMGDALPYPVGVIITGYVTCKQVAIIQQC